MRNFFGSIIWFFLCVFVGWLVIQGGSTLILIILILYAILWPVIKVANIHGMYKNKLKTGKYMDAKYYDRPEDQK